MITVNDLMESTFVFPEDSTCKATLETVCTDVAEAMNNYFPIEFQEALSNYPARLSIAVFVSPEDFSKILLHPAIKGETVATKSMGESFCINIPSYRHCVWINSRFDIEVFAFSYYKGKPTCDIGKMFIPRLDS